MIWYQWFALASAAIGLAGCAWFLYRLLSLGNVKDSSVKAGSTKMGIAYAFTGAMSPARKESAFLHLPTYVAGILYHLGTFLSLALFVVIFGGTFPEGIYALVLAVFLTVCGLSGLSILAKRIIKKELRLLSNADDYISNIVVTLFHLISAALMIRPELIIAYHLVGGILMIYIPVGKLRHVVFFFAARYHLGYFFGWRNVWPAGPKNQQH